MNSMSTIKLVGNLERHFDFESLTDFVLKVQEWQEWDTQLRDKGVSIEGNPLESATCLVVDMLTQGRDDLTNYFWNEVIWGDATAEDFFEKLMKE